MATVPELIRDLSVVLRIKEKTIATHARHIREAGMLSQGGRGVNAAQATPLDAARLLIALSIPGNAKDSPQAVKDFGKTVLYQSHEDEEKRPELHIGPLLNLGNRCNLETAIARVIAMYGDEEKMEILDDGGQYLPGVRVELKPIFVGGTLQIQSHEYLFHHINNEQKLTLLDLDFSTMSEADQAEYKATSAEFDRLHNTYFCGIRQTIEIAGPELDKIGRMLAGLREPGFNDEEAQLEALMKQYRKNGGASDE